MKQCIPSVLRCCDERSHVNKSLLRAGGSGPADLFWPDHIFTQAKKKLLVGFHQRFMAWQKKSSKYSNNVATHYSMLATTDHPWYHSHAWSLALLCEYKIETRAWFRALVQQCPKMHQNQSQNVQNCKNSWVGAQTPLVLHGMLMHME